MVSEAFFDTNPHIGIQATHETTNLSIASAVSSAATVTTTATVTSSVSSSTTSTSALVHRTPPSSGQREPNAASDCDRWAQVPPGTYCDSFADSVAIDVVDLWTWNPDIDGACSNLLAGFWFCVGVSSRKYSRGLPIPWEYNPQRSEISTGLSIRDDDGGDEKGPTFDAYSANTTRKGSFQPDDIPELWHTAYAMSPFVAWSFNKSFDSTNTSQWPGINRVPLDLGSLSENTNGSSWDSLVSTSSDWSKLTFEECLDTFSFRYRSSAGTVIQVVDYNSSSNGVLGLAYVSYNSTRLSIMCPTAFLDQQGRSNCINEEDRPFLPLMYGMFGQETGYDSSGKHDKHIDAFPDHRICPSTCAGEDGYIPVSKGCFLRNRSLQCRIGYNVPFFVAIIGWLLVTLLCLILALILVKDPPLFTVGDAIANYIDSEDVHTKGCSLAWTVQHGWQCVGPIPTYYPGDRSRSGPARISGFFRIQWAKVWPSWGHANHDDVPKLDIMNYSNTMKSMNKTIWFTLYLCTLGVAAGIFTSVAQQDGWTTVPKGENDLRWMVGPTVLINLPQVFAAMRGFCDNKILTERNCIQEFAGFACSRRGLRASNPVRGTAQRDTYFFGNINFLINMILALLQIFYAFILNRLVIPRWINPLRPNDPDDYFSPAFLMRFGNQETLDAKMITEA